MATVTALAGPVLVYGAVLLTVACAHTVGGTAVRPVPAIDEDSRSPVDVGTLMLDTAQMRALTGAGDDLTIIPSMDSQIPVDIEPLMETVSPQCEWIFAETQTFGPDIEEFHKTTFQNPPDGALISQGAAGYLDAATAQRAFDALVTLVDGCDATGYGSTLVGTWNATPDSLQTRTSEVCGRDYRVKSAVLVEVTFCRFAASVPDLVMTNIVAKVPG